MRRGSDVTGSESDGGRLKRGTGLRSEGEGEGSCQYDGVGDTLL